MNKNITKIEPILFKESIISDWYNYLIIFLWFIPVFLKISSVDESNVVASSILAALVSFLILFIKPDSVLLALPFFTILSPVAGYLKLFGVPVLLSDIFFIFLTIQLILLIKSGAIATFNNKMSKNFSIIAALYFFSFVLAICYDLITSYKSILYLIQFIILFIYVNTYSKNEDMQYKIVNYWIISSILGVLLLIHGYRSGIVLSDFKLNSKMDVDKYSSQFFFQATYYYTGFHQNIGMSFVILVTKLIHARSIINKLLILTILPLLFYALIIMMNKTAMFSIVASLVIIAVVTIFQRNIKPLLFFIFLCTVIFVESDKLITPIFDSLGATQSSIWFDRLQGTSSLETRVEVVTQAMSKFIEYPVQVIFGMGPGFLENAGDSELSGAFKTSATTGVEEGTVDSGWISYFIELGIVNFIILIAVYIKSMANALNSILQNNLNEKTNETSIYIFSGLVYLSISLFSQMLGYTKLTWFPFQLLLFGLLLKNNNTVDKVHKISHLNSQFTLQ